MKKYSTLISSFFITSFIYQSANSQLEIETFNPDYSSILDITVATDKGFPLYIKVIKTLQSEGNVLTQN
ncbi:hypothetical protein [Flavobacterium sp. U410]|jgi:hypothetical protein